MLQELLKPVPGDLRCPQHGSGCREVESLPPKGFYLLQLRLDHQDLGPHCQVRPMQDERFKNQQETSYFEYNGRI